MQYIKEKKILFIIIALLLIIIGGIFLYNKLYNNEFIEIEYEVTEGASWNSVASDLKEAGIINSAGSLVRMAKKDNGVIYSNKYYLNSDMELEYIYNVLNNAQTNIESDYKIVVNEGDTIEELATEISDQTNFSEDDVLSFWAEEANLKQWIKHYEILTDEILNTEIKYPLEGYFQPATYTFATEPTLEELTLQFLDERELYLSEIGFEPYASYHELLTIASIVERETLHDDDKKDVAGVFMNRLASEMPFQSDITVLYALGEHKERVLYSDLEVDSPYNTYITVGLPPGPISSPSAVTIEATKDYNTNDYYYFFATQDTGDIIFSETYEEHQKVIEENAWEFEE